MEINEIQSKTSSTNSIHFLSLFIVSQYPNSLTIPSALLRPLPMILLSSSSSSFGDFRPNKCVSPRTAPRPINEMVHYSLVRVAGVDVGMRSCRYIVRPAAAYVGEWNRPRKAANFH